MKFLLFLPLLCLGCGYAHAAELPNWQHAPLYGTQGLGEVALEAGGGSTDISTLGQGCAGFINAAQPDVNIDLPEAGPLKLSVQSSGDTVLLVFTPEQNWLCADDVSDTALNPVLNIPKASAGVYNIWVGTAEAGHALKAMLNVENE